jgi:hypothetical protein
MVMAAKVVKEIMDFQHKNIKGYLKTRFSLISDYFKATI